MRVHPLHLLEPEDLALFDLWRLYRRGHLPHAGGAAEQPTYLLDAFALMDATAPHFERRGDDGGSR